MDYQEQDQANREKFMLVLKEAMPDVHILVTLLDQAKVSPVPLYAVIRHLSEIGQGTGYGDVHIMVEDGICRFVRGNQSTKLNEPVFLTKKEEEDEITPEN